MNGRIAIDRGLLEWEWITDIKTSHLWLCILLNANWKDKEWRGMIIPRGSFVTSLESLCKYGLTIQEVRTALKKLESTGEISKKTTNKFTIITVEKYDFYQDFDTVDNKQITNEQQTNNKQITNEQQQLNKDNKENKGNKGNKGNKEYIAEQSSTSLTPKTTKKKSVPKETYGEYENVKLTQAEFDRLVDEYGMNDTLDAIKFLDEYIEEKGKDKSKSHNLTLRRWVFNAVKEQRSKNKQNTGLPFDNIFI